MSSLYFQNLLQIKDLIEDHGYQDQVDPEEWSRLPQFQWFNPEIFFLSLLLYQDGIKSRNSLKKEGFLNSLLARYSGIVNSIEGNRDNIMVMIIRYLLLMIDFKG